MASAAAPENLPLFYQRLEPLSTNTHASFRTRPTDKAPFLAQTHAVPLTVDEFVLAQRYYPIVFSVGDNPVPLALMGLNEGLNVFVDPEGKLRDEVYVPAYVRRYPFMLARLNPNAEELSLCFDPTSDSIGPFPEGEPLFTDAAPSETTQTILKFCEEFELSAARTGQFVKELDDAGLLIDGEVSIQAQPEDPPSVYRGFKMVAEEKLRELRGDVLRRMNQNGMLPLIFAHLFSLSIVRDLFAREITLGLMPLPSAAVDPGAVG